MRILVIGDASSSFVRCYIEYVLMPKNDEIYLTCEKISDTKYLEFYKNNNVKLIELTSNIPQVITKIPKVRGLINTLVAERNLNKYLKGAGKFDIIHIHGMWKRSCFICKNIYEYTDKLICTYWGSDLFRVPIKGSALGCLNSANYITVATQAMLDKFTSEFGHQFDSKIKNVKFGIYGFSAIDKISKTETKENCKEHFGIDSDSTVISIGYNAKREHQHLKVINELKKLPNLILSKITIVLQMTYGLPKTDVYFSELETELKNMPCKYKILTDFMSDDNIAKLRLATDIFIHAQTTDAFSASIQEYLYTGTCTVINPVWIKYDELKNNNVNFIEYSDFSEISSLVSDIVEIKKPKLSENKSILRDMSSWDSVKNIWYSLYK